MLDLDWERSIAIIDMNFDEIKDIFTQYENKLIVTDFRAIQHGCRNSNFVVCTDKGKYLLRIASIAELNNEIMAYELAKDKINVPKLLFYTTNQKSRIFLYQYIKGVSLQKHIIDNNQCDHSLLNQVAQTAAIIHNTPEENTIGLAKYDVPPFEMWFKFFLDMPIVRTRIGEGVCKKIEQLVSDKQNLLPIIDKYHSFIHCDFRPANMLVDEYGQVFFVDWESASVGHTLTDIGQFFRYRSFFKETHIELFEKVYNEFAKWKLPDNWFELSLFIDLVNPLQLLSINQETPFRIADLINIIEATLAYWGY